MAERDLEIEGTKEFAGVVRGPAPLIAAGYEIERAYHRGSLVRQARTTAPMTASAMWSDDFVFEPAQAGSNSEMAAIWIVIKFTCGSKTEETELHFYNN